MKDKIILQLWKSLDSFRGESEISTWIYRVSLNTILTIARKSVIAEPFDSYHSYIPSANADDDMELLSLILQSVKALDKAIVILHLEGYRNKEIAEILELSPTNVATRFNRLKSQLKVKFNSDAYATK